MSLFRPHRRPPIRPNKPRSIVDVITHNAIASDLEYPVMYYRRQQPDNACHNRPVKSKKITSSTVITNIINSGLVRINALFYCGNNVNTADIAQHSE